MSDAPVPARSATPPNRAAFAILVLGAVLIGMSPIFVRLSEVGPIATAFWRAALAVPAFLLWDRLATRDRPSSGLGPGDRRRLLLAGLLFAGDLATWHLAILKTSVANATLFASLAPVMVAAGAWALFGERPGRSFLLALGLALAGAACLVGASVEIAPARVAGDATGMVTALFFGAYVLAVKDLRMRLPAARLMAWSSAATALALLPLALLVEGVLWPSTLSGALVLVGLALVSQTAGQGFVAEALGHLPAGFSSLVILVEPVAAAIAAWLVLSEGIAPLQMAGGLLVLGGIMIARRAQKMAEAPA